MAVYAPSFQLQQLGGSFSHLVATRKTTYTAGNLEACFPSAHVICSMRILRIPPPSTRGTCALRFLPPSHKVLKLKLLSKAGHFAWNGRPSATDSDKPYADLDESVLESEPFKREVLALVQEDEVSTVLEEVLRYSKLSCAKVDSKALVKAACKAIQHEYFHHPVPEGLEESIATFMQQVGVDEPLATLLELELGEYLLKKEKAVEQKYRRN